MKIEMFEKVGEINVIALRSAEENRVIAEAEQKRQEYENACIANEVLAKLVDAINTEADKGNQRLYIEWQTRGELVKPFGIGWDEYGKAIKYMRPILECAGYKVDKRYSYSSSWTNKSDKLGYVYIRW